MVSRSPAMPPGTDVRGQGPVLIGVRPNACELNEKITRCGEESAAVAGAAAAERLLLSVSRGDVCLARGL